MTANGSLRGLRGNKNGATMPGDCYMISDNVVVARTLLFDHIHSVVAPTLRLLR